MEIVLKPESNSKSSGSVHQFNFKIIPQIISNYSFHSGEFNKSVGQEEARGSTECEAGFTTSSAMFL